MTSISTLSAYPLSAASFSEAADAAYALKMEMERLLSKVVPLKALTDSKQLFDSVINATRTKDRRLMIDLKACKEMYQRKEISDLGLVKSEFNFKFCQVARPPDQGIQGERKDRDASLEPSGTSCRELGAPW